MGKISLLFFFFFLVALSSTSRAQNKPPLAPSLYVFGDSTVAAINQTLSAKNYADFIALSLGLPLVPPSADKIASAKSATGVNYAVGGSPMIEGNEEWMPSFKKQVAEFNATLRHNLTITLGKGLAQHLKKSIFFVSFGINDFYYNYVWLKLPVDGVVTNLLSELERQLRALYALGARKFLINNVWPIGCAPVNLDTLSRSCNETINTDVLKYNKKLPGLLKGLESKLSGTTISTADNFKFVKDLKSNTAKYGITDFAGECKSDEKNWCEKNLYSDFIHTTPVANRAFAQECFNGRICRPNIATMLRA